MRSRSWKESKWKLEDANKKIQRFIFVVIIVIVIIVIVIIVIVIVIVILYITQ